MNNNYITERDITQALKARHDKRGDYFASQVKMGPAGSKIMDAIAIPITWSPRTVIGYEIKVSKYDFMNDQKYPHYMTTCNLFYFVVPKGLIEKNEVPDNVGIIEYNNGNLRQVKKALYRKVEINTDMLLHCIFYKVHEYSRPKTKKEYLEDYKARVESKAFGNAVADKMRKLERKLIYGDDDWANFKKIFEDKFGFTPSLYRVFDYISLDNKKYNDAIKLLDRIEELMRERTLNKLREKVND